MANKTIRVYRALFGIILLLAPSFSNEIGLSVKETLGFSRNREMVHNGIPISRLLNVRNTNNIRLVDSEGNNVDAQFEILARWAGGIDGGNPIKWLLVSFPADVDAFEEKAYKLVAGTQRIRGTSLIFDETEDALTVNTGVAVFEISKRRLNIFNRISLSRAPETNLVESSGEAVLHVDGKPLMVAQPPDSIAIEHQGPLFVTVRLSGHFSNPPYSNIPWKYTLRYSFHADGAAAELDFSFSFPGTKNGDRNLDVWDKGLLVKMRGAHLTLPLNLGGEELGYVAAEKQKSLSSSLGSGTGCTLKQRLRTRMKEPPTYTMDVGTQNHSGGFATLPFVAVKGESGMIGATIQKFRYYEPQALKADARKIEIHVVTDSQWCSSFMGAFAKCAVAVGAPEKPFDALAHATHAALERRLVAWPGRGYVAHTGVFDELW
ncbi:MAG: hypothetical protein GF344_09535, partial [Chitinivibrionales bacterium]|nr:hypothetical protein [Chitinivibrionales bacterium]MBD3357083.1 hypothetical protein [Chitinivibrionales bacterium]